MIIEMKKTTLTLAMLLTGMAASTAVQAGDIKPLHHDCYMGNSINWPKPSTGPSGLVNGTNTQGGSGSLLTGFPKVDLIDFTCPVNRRGSFEINVRKKTTGYSNLSPYNTGVKATILTYPLAIGSLPFVQDNWGGNAIWDQNPGTVAATIDQGVQTVNQGGAATVRVRVEKVGPGIASTPQRNYELCVQCYQNPNEGGLTAQPSSATYFQNQ
jgi:hypothetical protein